MTVRSYRHARRLGGRSHLGRSWVSLSTPQLVFGGFGTVVGLAFGLLALPSAWILAVGLAGGVGGLWVGSQRRDGRDPFQILYARVLSRRPSIWSPRWGALHPHIRHVRYQATAHETQEVSPCKPMLELTSGTFD